MPLTGDRTYVPSERSGRPTIAIIGAINSPDIARGTCNGAAPVLAKDTWDFWQQASTSHQLAHVQTSAHVLGKPLESAPVVATLRQRPGHPQNTSPSNSALNIVRKRGRAR